jgi:hypothetical protein
MSEDFPNERSYSAFWPIVIFLAAFAISSFYQLYEVAAHRSYVNSQLVTAEPTLKNAKAAQDRLVALMNDLLATGSKDSNAAQIIREAKQAGIIRERQTTDTSGSTSTDTNAAPTPP